MYLLFAGPTFGFFSIMIHLIGTIHGFAYDHKLKNKYTGLKVCIDRTSLYYSRKHGKNMYNYFYEPLDIGDTTGVPDIITKTLPNGMSGIFVEETLDKWSVNTIIEKYVQLNEKTKTIIDDFYRLNFENDCYHIGIHYRGTDKFRESPRVAYEKVVDEINKIKTDKPVVLYVATDEQGFLDYIRVGHKIICIADASRSTNNLDNQFHQKDQYLSGLHAVMDCYLLARCDFLIRTSSNLSLWSTYVQPRMPVKLLNDRY